MIKHPLLAALLALTLTLGLGSCRKSPEVGKTAPHETKAETATGSASPEEEAGIPAASVSLAIETVPVRNRPIAIEKTAIATIAPLPDRSADLGFKSTGRIDRLTVSEGDHVSKGQVLGTQLENRQAQSQLAIAQANVKRDEELFAKGIIARRQLEATQLQAQEAALNLAVTALIAPFSGLVTKRLHGVGELVDPSTPVVSIADLSTVYAIASVYESDVADFKTGQAVTVTTTSYTDRRFTGTVELLGAALDPTSRTLQAKVRVPNPDRALKIGMSALVAVKKGAREALAVPSSSLLEAAGGGKQVFVREGDRYEVRPVKVGQVAGDWVEVQEGLLLGEAVVTRGAFELQAHLNRGSLAADDD